MKEKRVSLAASRLVSGQGRVSALKQVQCYKNSKCADDPPSDGCVFSWLTDGGTRGLFRIMTILQAASRPVLHLPLMIEPEDSMFVVYPLFVPFCPIGLGFYLN